MNENSSEAQVGRRLRRLEQGYLNVIEILKSIQAGVTWSAVWDEPLKIEKEIRDEHARVEAMLNRPYK